MEDLFSEVLNKYFEEYQGNNIDIEIILANKISNVYKEKGMDMFDLIQGVGNNRGVMIPPRLGEEKFTIVLNKAYIEKMVKNKDFQWVGTLTHEVTHALDYMNYAKLRGIKDYDIIQRGDIHRPFVLWTEFNARARGYLYVRKFTFGINYNDMYDRTQFEYICRVELPYQLEHFLESYETAENLDMKLYEVMQLLGRYFIWEKLFPNIFGEENRKNILGIKQGMLELYRFLFNHHDLENANRNFDDMRRIINCNFIIK